MKVKNKLLTAFSSLKNQAAITRAVMADKSILSEIDFSIVHCTDQQDRSIDEKYVHGILYVVTNNPGSITFLARRISKQIEGTRDLVIAMKTLVLVHRLLRSGDRYFEQDMYNLWSSRELRMDLSWCSFLKGQLTSFLINYSLFLEQRMSWAINQAGMLEPVMPTKPELQSDEKDSAEVIFFRLSKCQLFLDEVMNCLHCFMESESPVVQSAMNMILRESFRVYDSFYEGVEIILNSYHKLEKSAKALALDILEKACIQTKSLDDFYHKCKRSMDGKNLDYPFIRIITTIEVSSLEQNLSNHSEIPSVVPKNMNSSGQRQGCQSEDRYYVEPHEASTVPFSGKLETIISSVWVKFNEDDHHTNSNSLDGFGDHLAEAARNLIAEGGIS